MHTCIYIYISAYLPFLKVKNATLIQPDVTQIFTNKSCGECGTPVHTPPLKMKGKGLLERQV